MKAEKIAALRSWISLVERSTPETLARVHDVRHDYRGGAYVMQLAGVSGTATMGREAAKESWLRAARKKIAQAEDECSDPVNLAGSGPVPIEPRER